MKKQQYSWKESNRREEKKKQWYWWASEDEDYGFELNLNVTKNLSR